MKLIDYKLLEKNIWAENTTVYEFISNNRLFIIHSIIKQNTKDECLDWLVQMVCNKYLTNEVFLFL